MPTDLLDPQLDQTDEADQELDNFQYAALNRPQAQPTAPAPVPQISSQPTNQVAPKSPAGPTAPPAWQDIQAVPQFQQFSAQDKQDAFTKWLGQMHDFSAASGYNPDKGTKQQITDWTAQQARDLGMASFVDPTTQNTVPINTGMIQDIGQRLLSVTGAAEGGAIQGLAHATRYIDPTQWGDAIFGAPKGVIDDSVVAAQAENIGKMIQAGAAKEQVNPIYDQSTEAKITNFIGQLLPVLNPAGPFIGAGMMAQAFKNDAADAGRTPLQQEGAFIGGGAIGGISNKLLSVAPWLNEAGAQQSLKDALTQSTSSTMLRALAVNGIRGGIEGGLQTAGDQVAQGQDLTSPQSLKEDLDGAMTFAIGGGLLGAGFKAMGVLPAKAAIRSQWEAQNADLQSSGKPPQTLADYVQARLAESKQPPPLPAPETATAPPPADTSPLDALNQDLEKQLASPSDPTVGDTLTATHPVFGDGNYPPASLLGQMGTVPIADGREQLTWKGQATDQVRQQDATGKYQYGPATSDDLANPAFQSPTLTKNDLLNPVEAKEATTEPTKETSDEKGQNANGTEERSSEQGSVLDDPGLGNDGRNDGADERAGRSETASSPDGAGDDASAHETVNEQPKGGGETSALPSTLDDEKEAKPAIESLSPLTQPEQEGEKAPDPDQSVQAVKPQVDQAVKASGTQLPVEYSTAHDTAAWADPNQRGKIFVNPTVLKTALDALPDDAAREEYLKRVMTEEEAHDAQHGVEADWKEAGTYDENIGKLYDEMSPKERADTLERYGDDRIDPAKAKDDDDAFQRKGLLVREYARQILQRKMSGETTEDVWKQGNKNGLLRYFQALYNKLKERVGRNPNSALGAYTKATEAILREGGAKTDEMGKGDVSGAAMPPETPEFKKFSEDSKVRDEDGTMKTVFHGSSKSGFKTFDPEKGAYGMKGDGFYFTENPDIASQYAKKGDKDGTGSRGVYPAYLSIKNPLDMEAKADPEKWANAFQSLDSEPSFTEGMSNNDAFREAEQTIASMDIPSYEGREMVQDGIRKMGYDGITHIGGGLHGNSDGTRHRVWVAFDPEQIKSATGNRGTFDPNDADITRAPMPPLPKAAKDMLDVGDKLQKELRADLPARYALDRTAAKRQLSAEQQRSTQQVNKIMTAFNKAVPDSVRADAITIYREAGGDMATLKKWEQGTTDPEMKKAYTAALDLTPTEKQWAQKIDQTYDLTRKRLVQMGVDVAEISNYANHVWKDNAIDKLKRATSKQLKTAFQYAKQRKIPSYFEGEQLGLEPETKNAGKLLGGYILDANRVIASRNFIANLSKGVEADGRPIVGPKTGGFRHIDNGDQGKIHLVFNGHAPDAFDDYRDDLKIPAIQNWAYKGSFDGTTIMGKSDMAIHPNAYTDLKNIFGRSPIREWWDSPSDSVAGQVVKSGAKFLLDDLNSYGKTTLFGGLPFFHAVQETMEGASHLSLPSKGSEYLKEPDLSDPAIYDKSLHGLMLAPDRASQALFEDGMDSAHRNLMLKLVKHIPGIGPKIQQAVDFGQNWLFETYIPSLKSKMYDVALERNQQRFARELASGKITMDQVKYLTADQTNNAFGHLNYTDIARNPLMQHVMQLGILAPDFTEARIRHAAQAAKGLLGNKGGREQTFAMVGMALAMFTTARVLNAALNNGDPKWDEPFSVINGNRRYGVRFAGGDILELFKNWRGWIGGRESPISRAGAELFTGFNYRGEPVSSTDAFKDALAGNMPMYLQPMLRDLSPNTKNNPVSPLEQFMGGMGMKISRYSPISQIYPLVDDWKKAHGSEFGIQPNAGGYPTSQFTPMRYALEDANYPAAWSEYQKLVAAKGPMKSGNLPMDFNRSLNASFTGNRVADQAFYASLRPDQQKVYDAAVARRQVLWDRFGQMMSNQGNPGVKAQYAKN